MCQGRGVVSVGCPSMSVLCTYKCPFGILFLAERLPTECYRVIFLERTMADKTSSPPSDERPSDERPAHCRSPLCDHRAAIEQMLARRYSYQQIAGALVRRGVTLGASEIGKWCRRQGLRSVVSSRHRTSTNKKSPSAPAAAPKAPAPATPAPAGPGKTKSLSDLLADDEAERGAVVDRFFGPKSE